MSKIASFVVIGLITLGFNSPAFAIQAGQYRGLLVNVSNEVNLPDRVTLGLVATINEGTVNFSGAMRFYLEKFTSSEYIQLKTKSMQYDVLRKQMTIKASNIPTEFTIVLQDIVDGLLKGVVYTDSAGQVAEIILTKVDK